MISRVPSDATEWWARRRARGLSPREQRAFDAWLENADNRRAYETIASVDAALDHGVAPPKFDGLLASARDGARTRRATVRRRARNRTIAITAVSAAAACAAIAFALRPVDYSTQPGHRLEVALSDGSTVTLDQASRVRVSYHPMRRDLTLLAGRAEFEVAHDTARPFVVTVGRQSVTALGTIFDVSKTGSAMSVTLAQGIVAVSVTPQRPIRLLPGKRLTSTERRVVIQDVDIQQATAWRLGKAIFDNTRLSDAVEEINANASRKIVIVGTLDCARLSGVYNLDDSYAVASAMASELSLRVSTKAGGEIVIDDPKARSCKDFGG